MQSMESKSTEKSDQNITRHLVTFTISRTKYAPTEKHTQLIEGDLADWYEKMNQDPTITKVIIDFALLLW